MQIPGGLLADKFGGKKIFLSGVFVSSISTIFTPAAAKTGNFWVLFFVRALGGLGQGVIVPVIHSMIAKVTIIQVGLRMTSRLAGLVFAIQKGTLKHDLICLS